MKRIFIIIVMAGLFASCCTGCVMLVPPTADALVVPASPAPGAVWVRGHWQWNHRQHRKVWIQGHWKVRRNHVWVIIR